MKKSEAIYIFYEQIIAAMIESFRVVLDHDGKIQHQIYIWEDGRIVKLEGPYGDHSSFLTSTDNEKLRLFYVCRIDWGYKYRTKNRDVDQMVEDYKIQAREILDYTYLEAIDEERCDW